MSQVGVRTLSGQTDTVSTHRSLFLSKGDRQRIRVKRARSDMKGT